MKHRRAALDAATVALSLAMVVAMAVHVRASVCDSSLFDVTQIRPADFSTYSPDTSGGGTWGQLLASDTKTHRLMFCDSTVSYMWKLEYYGMNEGVASAIVFLKQFSDNGLRTPLPQRLSWISSIGMNYDDPMNDPPLQPTVLATAEEIEKPDEELEDGKYFRVQVSGLMGPATVVIRIDFETECAYDVAKVAGEESLRSSLLAKIVKDVSVDCVAESEISETGKLKHRFGALAASVEKMGYGVNVLAAATDRQTDNASRGAITLQYGIIPDGGTSCADAVSTYSYPAGTCTSVTFCYTISNNRSTDLVDVNITDGRWSISTSDDVRVVTGESLSGGETKTFSRVFTLPPYGGLTSISASVEAYIAPQFPARVGATEFVTVNARGTPECTCVAEPSVTLTAYHCNALTGNEVTDVVCSPFSKSSTPYRCVTADETPTHQCYTEYAYRCEFQQSTGFNSYLCKIRYGTSFFASPLNVTCPE